MASAGEKQVEAKWETRSRAEQNYVYPPKGELPVIIRKNKPEKSFNAKHVGLVSFGETSLNTDAGLLYCHALLGL